jgi:hypothetical protein
MAYEDERNRDLDRQMYEEDPAYEADTYFGERLSEPISDGSAMDVDEFEEDDATDADADASFGEKLDATPATDDVAEAEGEPIKPTAEPAVEDQEDL